jgi:hypothetical protein
MHRTQAVLPTFPSPSDALDLRTGAPLPCIDMNSPIYLAFFFSYHFIIT